MSNFATLKVNDVVYETEEAVSIHFKQPLFGKIKYKSGQFLTLCIDINGEEFRRAYSLNSSPKVDKTLCVTVKKIDNGKVSNHIFKSIKSGDKIKVIKPTGNFTIVPDKKISRHIVLIAGGSGITPMMSMAKTILHEEPNSIVSLIYSNRQEGSIIFNEHLKEMVKDFEGRFTIRHILSQPSAEWQGLRGRLDPAKLREIISTLPEKEEREFYICGPEGMMNVSLQTLTNLGISEKKINLESFASSVKASKSEDGDAKNTVKVTFRKKERLVVIPNNKTILDGVLDYKIRVPYSCCSGACATCMAKVTAGEVEMAGGSILSDKEKQEGFILTCVSFAKSKDVEIDFDV